MTDIQQARKWAEWADKKLGVAESHANAHAAAEVIQSLPDQWIDAEKVREIYDCYRASEITLHEAFRAAVALTTPPLPTLADMTPEERGRCLWMQVDLPRHLPGAVLTDPGSCSSEPRVMYQDGASFTVKHEEVTPLPDLPKLEWPGEGVEDAPVADGEPTLPRPEDVPEGEPWIVLYEGEEWAGVRVSGPDEHVPWSIIRMNGLSYRDVSDSDITLISRLVPEAKP